ncbi:MAG: TetR/AcrR family transcriptional regulator [Desulfobacteraceae bacterium]|nr:TetR/AcrR family transcriptional regulator [Desulfobacteraceae bacterium]
MNRRETTKAETSEIILASAKKILLENGIVKCTMRSVAAEAGVSPASVVVHFKTKTGLIEAALHEDIEHTIMHAIAGLPEDRPLLDRLMHIWGAMFRFYDTNRNLYRELLRSTTFETDADSPHIKEQMDRFLRFLSTIVRDEQAAGNIDSRLESLVAAESLGAFYFMMLIRFIRDPEMTPAAAAAHLAKITQQFLAGIEPQLG